MRVKLRSTWVNLNKLENHSEAKFFFSMSVIGSHFAKTAISRPLPEALDNSVVRILFFYIKEWLCYYCPLPCAHVPIPECRSKFHAAFLVVNTLFPPKLLQKRNLLQRDIVILSQCNKLEAQLPLFTPHRENPFCSCHTQGIMHLIYVHERKERRIWCRHTPPPTPNGRKRK